MNHAQRIALARDIRALRHEEGQPLTGPNTCADQGCRYAVTHPREGRALCTMRETIRTSASACPLYRKGDR